MFGKSLKNSSLSILENVRTRITTNCVILVCPIFKILEFSSLKTGRTVMPGKKHETHSFEKQEYMLYQEIQEAEYMLGN